MRWSEKTNVRIVMINANTRIDRTCSGLKNMMSRAPTAGAKVMIVRMCDVIRESMRSLSQKPRHDKNSAQQDPAGIDAYITRLHMTQRAGCTANHITCAVHRAVDNEAIDELPEELTRCGHDRPDDCRVVDLVDVILVRKDG